MASPFRGCRDDRDLGADSGAVRTERHPAAGEEEQAYRAFLQPVRERREDWYQEMPTPLGTVRRDQWLYLGPPELSLEETNGLCVEWNGLRFVVRAAQPVCVGEETLYWWALLAVEDGEAQTEQT